MAESIRWSPMFESGDDHLDDEHRALFEYINMFCGAGAEPPPRDARWADHLILRLNAHFAAEEQAMAGRGYALADVHKADHIGILDAIESIQDQYRRDILDWDEVETFVKGTIVGHTAVHDTRFARCSSERDRQRTLGAAMSGQP